VTKTELVACHTLGASFWLPVPEVLCTCCSSTWVLQPAAAGFFGSSPVRPGLWFSQQLLDTYTALYGLGTSATGFPEALSRTAATVESYAPPLDRLADHLLPIDARQVLHTVGSLCCNHVVHPIIKSNLNCIQPTPNCVVCRHLRSAGTQWRAASASWCSIAGTATLLGQQELGPAACCPACAAVPEQPEEGGTFEP
jgi:hypothetical protein